MLSQIGCVAVPEETLARWHDRKDLTSDEREAIESYPVLGAKLIAHIPRLEQVAEMITHQERRLDEGGLSGGTLPRGSRVLKVALDFDMLTAGGLPPDMAMAVLNDRPGWYDPAILAALRQALSITEVQVLRRVTVHELTDGMVLADDVRTLRGTLLCARGQEVTPSMRLRLKNYVANLGVHEAIKVFVPAAKAAHLAAGEPSACEPY